MASRDHPFARAGREMMAVVRGTTPTHRDLRDRLTVVIAVTVLVDLVCGVLALLLERGIRGTEIHGLGDALFFSTTQLLTVSSSIRNPLSTGGRLLDVGMELYAITVVASLAGMTASFFHRRSTEERSA